MIKDRSAFAPFSTISFTHLPTASLPNLSLHPSPTSPSIPPQPLPPSLPNLSLHLSSTSSFIPPQPPQSRPHLTSDQAPTAACSTSRTILAELLLAFDIEFPPGDDSTGAGFEAQGKDRFTLAFGELNLVFPKKGASTIRKRTRHNFF